MGDSRLDFQHLPKVWWYHPEDCKDSSIALFAHADYLNNLLDRYFGNDKWLKNCEIVSVVVDSAADLVPRKPAVIPKAAEPEEPPAPPEAAKPKAIPRASKGLMTLKKEIAALHAARGEEVKPPELNRLASQKWKELDQAERE